MIRTVIESASDFFTSKQGRREIEQLQLSCYLIVPLLITAQIFQEAQGSRDRRKESTRGNEKWKIKEQRSYWLIASGVELKRIEERERERERGGRPVEIKCRRKDKAGGDWRSPSNSALSAFPPPDWNFSFRVIKAVGQYSVLMGLSVGNLIARWDEMGLPLYPILGMFGADRFDAILLPGR
ncbi:hypothetical protein CMV_025439 [Castanea mollissima]|uniref:Uncharacterized protein n=1 Tax=Castanea mollissima TaxID=60419 RepID=A0A8J4VGT1_9ROSI|nr:hypothetical protein CMV_025439 [Castanea mollissima]